MEEQTTQIVSQIEVSTDINKSLRTSIVRWTSINWKAVLAEVISTSLLIIFGCMSCIPLEGFVTQPPLYGPFGFGLAVLFNIQIFGHISGAHMNPAVTFAAMIWGLIPVPLGIIYVIAQCIGSVLGYGVLLAVSPIDLVNERICLTLPHAEHNIFQALGVEILLTATLAFVCCGVWDPINQHKQDSIPLRFGLAVAGLSIAGGPLTGASMNPARSLGPALWTGIWDAHWIYWVGPSIGSILATIIYKFILLSEEATEKKSFDSEQSRNRY